MVLSGTRLSLKELLRDPNVHLLGSRLNKMTEWHNGHQATNGRAFKRQTLETAVNRAANNEASFLTKLVIFLSFLAILTSLAPTLTMATTAHASSLVPDNDAAFDWTRFLVLPRRVEEETPESFNTKERSALGDYLEILENLQLPRQDFTRTTGSLSQSADLGESLLNQDNQTRDQVVRAVLVPQRELTPAEAVAFEKEPEKRFRMDFFKQPSCYGLGEKCNPYAPSATNCRGWCKRAPNKTIKTCRRIRGRGFRCIQMRV